MIHKLNNKIMLKKLTYLEYSYTNSSINSYSFSVVKSIPKSKSTSLILNFYSEVTAISDLINNKDKTKTLEKSIYKMKLLTAMHQCRLHVPELDNPNK